MKRGAFLFSILFLIQSAFAASEDGNEQVTQMLKDRPAMATYSDSKGVVHTLAPDDPLFVAAATLFEVDGSVTHIAWNSQQPTTMCEIADHSISTAQNPVTWIRLSTTEPCYNTGAIPFERLWSALFFEFENILNDSFFTSLTHDAYAGKFSKCEWVEQTTRLEYSALNLQKTFYLSTFAPWATGHDFVSNSGLWKSTLPSTYESWAATFKNPNSYPWDSWGSFYDNQISFYLNESNIPIPTRSCPDLPIP